MPAPTINVGPVPGAAEAFSAKAPITTPLGSAAMEELPLGLKETATWSATLEAAGAVDRIVQRVGEAVAGLRRSLADGSEGAVSGRSAFVNELRQIMTDEGLMPIDGKLGTIQDLTSENRLKLIFDTLYDRTVGYVGWKNEQNQAVLDAAPAQELVRIGRRRVPRNWIARWSAAGGSFYDGRMIARKDDPIWSEISRFGSPYPPFDFNSGMGLRDVLRREAIQLGVIGPDTKVKPQDKAFTDNLQASVKDLSQDAQNYLKKTFGDQIQISGDTAKWKGAA